MKVTLCAASVHRQDPQPPLPCCLETSKEIYYPPSPIAARRRRRRGTRRPALRRYYPACVVIALARWASCSRQHFARQAPITIINRPPACSRPRRRTRHLADGKPSTPPRRSRHHAASAGGQDCLFTKPPSGGCRSPQSSLLIIDIAAPRNFDPAVNDIDNVFLTVSTTSPLSSRMSSSLRRGRPGCRDHLRQDRPPWTGWASASRPLVGQMKEQFERIQRNE